MLFYPGLTCSDRKMLSGKKIKRASIRVPFFIGLKTKVKVIPQTLRNLFNFISAF